MIEILFENEDFLACIKPVGVPSQCDGAEDAIIPKVSNFWGAYHNEPKGSKSRILRVLN